MATKKKAAKKRAAKKSPAKKARKRSTKKKDAAHHLATAHRHVMRVVESVTISDRPHIEKLRRALDHAHDNTRHNGRQS